MFPHHRQMYMALQRKLGVEPGLRSHVYEGSPFLGTSINTGPRAETRFHRDAKNLVGGICAIGAFGNFDHRTSAHLILKEPKLIIEFKHGDVVIIPSAAVTHCNSPLQEGDDRVSVVQYTAAGCFRHSYQGNRVQSEMAITEIGTIKGEGSDRFVESWNLFHSVEDYRKAQNTGFVVSRDVFNEVDSGLSLLVRS